LSTSCNNAVILSSCYKIVTHNLLTNCWNNLYNKSVELNNLVASCQQAVDNLSTSWEQAVRTHLVDKLLERYCYKSAAGLLQHVRLYVYYSIEYYSTNKILTCTNHVSQFFLSRFSEIVFPRNMSIVLSAMFPVAKEKCTTKHLLLAVEWSILVKVCVLYIFLCSMKECGIY
jgi:hypothetical protein